jgi:hypothetical protein
MPLTPGQLNTLKTAILAETDPTFVGYRTEGSTGLMAQWFNQLASPAHPVWATGVDINAILDAIDFSQYTPNTTPLDATAAISTARLLSIQTKQMNLQNMTIGRDRLNCSRDRVREGLLDAVIDIPSGANGALRSAAGSGGIRVVNSMIRAATRGEKIFATTTDITGTVIAFNLGYEGSISDTDVVLALNT